MLVSIQFTCKLIQIWSFHFIVQIGYNNLIVWINRLHVIVRISRNNFVYKWITSQWWHCWTNQHIPLVVALFFFFFPSKAANSYLPNVLPWFFSSKVISCSFNLHFWTYFSMSSKIAAASALSSIMPYCIIQSMLYNINFLDSRNVSLLCRHILWALLLAISLWRRVVAGLIYVNILLLNPHILFLEHSLKGVVNESNSDSSYFLHCSLGSVL